MATVTESSESETPPAHVNHSTTTTTTSQPQTLDATPFIDYAVGQALFYQKAFNDALGSAIDASKSRFSQIRSTSSAHFHSTLVKPRFLFLFVFRDYYFLFLQNRKSAGSRKLWTKPFGNFTHSVGLFIYLYRKFLEFRE